VDSQGNVFAMNNQGVYRYGAYDDGEPTPWPEQSEYTKAQSFGDLLAIKTRNSELAKKPGFGEEFSGFAIDDQDNIYLGRPKPDRCIQVFDNRGKFLRSLRLPDDRKPAKIRWLGNGILAAVGIGSNPEGAIFLIDVRTGEVKKRIEDNNRLVLWAAPEGSFIAGHDGVIVRRYTREGDPLPFDAALAYVRDNELRFAPHELGLPKDSPELPEDPKGYTIAADGSFAVSNGLEANDALANTELLSYSNDGRYQPQTIQVSLGQRVPGNVFLDNAPVVFDLFVTNFSDHETPLTLNWTLTDFDGKKTMGASQLSAKPMSRQTFPLSIATATPVITGSRWRFARATSWSMSSKRNWRGLHRGTRRRTAIRRLPCAPSGNSR
jgi:hypothetical protein